MKPIFLRKIALASILIASLTQVYGCGAPPMVSAGTAVAREFSAGLLKNILIEIIADNVSDNVLQNSEIAYISNDLQSGWSQQLAKQMTQAEPLFLPQNLTLECQDSESDQACFDRNRPQVQQIAAEIAKTYQKDYNRIAEKRLKDYEIAYEYCHDKINESDIDLDDYNQIFDLKIQCLINQGFEKEIKTLTDYSENISRAYYTSTHKKTTPKDQFI